MAGFLKNLIVGNDQRYPFTQMYFLFFFHIGAASADRLELLMADFLSDFFDCGFSSSNKNS